LTQFASKVKIALARPSCTRQTLSILGVVNAPFPATYVELRE